MDSSVFISRVREALGKPAGAAPPSYAGLRESLQEVATRAREAHERNAAQRADLLDALADMSAKAGWKVARRPSIEAALGYLSELAASKQLRRVVHTTHPVFQRLPLHGAFPDLERTPLVQGNSLTPQELRQKANEADLGVTGVDFAIAETGTCVLIGRRGASRLVSLLPPVHVAVVEPEQVVASLDDVFLARRLAYLQGETASYMNFISGPSRTGDIEQTIVVGAHGPGETHLLILG